ncbi:Cell wall assembly regulator SMI1 [Chitinophaga eiseniae]|uniref:Cell wall assembly regulator SMI1 n=1 Tax=Chitinophaga eiseniae TaxID=634771 RepID=A0A1T4TUN2_9BACT|nr:SMI1/KNR4 family protein [Chitinophaga eiseniae]SKA44185.1 Cell wall assembly regulator SMI1 [Chitinophaga eiseniae]
MQNTLATLDQHLSQLRPELYANLNAPLTEDAIAALEKSYGIALPADVKTLYQWKNGQRDDYYEAFVNNSTFLPLQEALEIAKELTGMIGYDFEIENWWHAAWIPLFHNGGGDYICYDTGGVFTGKQGQLLKFWHDDGERKVIAPGLEAFLQIINQYYEDTDPAAFDEFFTLEHYPEGYPKAFYVE